MVKIQNMNVLIGRGAGVFGLLTPKTKVQGNLIWKEMKWGMVAAGGLSPVVRGARALPQRACGGSQGRLRAARGNPRHPCGLPGSIPAAGLALALIKHIQNPWVRKILGLYVHPQNIGFLRRDAK